MNDNTPPADTALPPLLRWVLAGQLRHVLSGAGMTLAAHGAIQSTQVDQFVQMGLGIALYAAGALWSLAEKKAIANPT